MISHRQILGNRGSTPGFSLVELLVVLGIGTILAALAIPALSSISNSYNLNSASQALLGQLSFARQNALATNSAVQVRFYQIADYRGNLVYRAIQAFQEKSDGAGNTTAFPITKVYYLPTQLWMVYSATLTAPSTLFTTGTSGAISSPSDTANPLPPPYGASPYIYFRFRPNGQTDLTASSTVTLSFETATIVANNLPANFITLRIDAINGNVKAYQP